MAQTPVLPRGFELPLEPRLPRIGSVDAVALEERAASLAKRSIKKDAKVFALELAVRMMDLTTLEGQDTPGKVAALCVEGDPARSRATPASRRSPRSASTRISFPPRSRASSGTSVKVASVATAFPSGQSPIETKLEEVRWVVEHGADEVDMVIDRGAFLSGRYAKVYDEIVQVKEACGDAHLKVILEVAELGTYDNVRRASLLAMAAGADFIKTSTGKLPGAATLPVDALHARGDPRRARGDGPHGRDEARGRHPPGEAGGAVPRAAARDARRRVADAGPLPPRRIVTAQRRADADSGRKRRAPTRARITSPLTDLERKKDRTPVPKEWAYAPAPGVARRRHPRRALRPLRRRQVARADRDLYDDLAARPRSRSPRSARRRPRRSTAAVAAARDAFENGWSGICPAAERAKYLFRIARILQERAREFAVLESLNGGKPIKESRDVDLPLAAAHFFYYAGWADKLEYAFPNRQPAAGRRRRPDHPVELPAADARVEDRARARVRATRSCSSPRRRRR